MYYINIEMIDIYADIQEYDYLVMKSVLGICKLKFITIPNKIHQNCYRTNGFKLFQFN